MLRLKEVLAYCVTAIPDVETWRVNKANYDYDKSITLYNDDAAPKYRYVYSGAKNYYMKGISFLVHWGENPTEAEEKAQELYDVINYKDFETDTYTCKVIPVYEEPVYIGLSDDGKIEYVINALIYYKKK